MLVLISLLSFSSCGGIYVSEPKRADSRMEQIISAIKDKDKEAIKSLFSKKAIGEANDIDSEIDYLFDFLQGDINSWKRDGWASDESIEYGKRSLLIRFAFIVNTEKDDYLLFVMDYNVDTINPDNKGIYTMEITRLEDRDAIQRSWQERLNAGIHKLE